MQKGDSMNEDIIFPEAVLIQDEKELSAGDLQVKVLITPKGDDKDCDDENLPLSQLQYKVLLTVEEANRYFGLGICCLRDAMRNPRCPFTVQVGNKKQLIHRAKLEAYLMDHKCF